LSDTTPDKLSQERTYPASVSSVLNRERWIVINRGTEDGVHNGQRFLLYELSAGEITDPNTGESLGRLEMPKGTGTVLHAQERMATIESDRFKETKTIKRMPLPLWPPEEEHIVPSQTPTPFDNPKVGDLVKPI
jgi:hypothetical protein